MIKNIKKQTKKHFLYIWTIFVLVLTLVPTPEFAGGKVTYYDKVAHVFLFGVFSYLLFGASELKRKTNVFIAVFAGISFSLLIEFLQTHVPGRTASHWDFLAGLFGVLIFSVLAYFYE